MTPTPDIDAEFAILTTEVGRALLAEVQQVTSPRPADLARWRKSLPPEVVAAAARLAACRRRGSAKFTRADRMWLSAVPLEQATAESVAVHKAARFVGSEVLDLCSGLGGDALALAGVGCRVVAVDLDHGMGRRLRWNAGVYGVEDRIAPVRGRAEAFAVPDAALVHLDPDRRAASGRRARAVQDYVPGLPHLLALAASRRGGAIKLGPGSDFAEGFAGKAFEVELTSLGGECKEATVWFGSLTSCRRRATCLPAGATWTDRDGPVGATAPSRPPVAQLYDPDPSLGRSGLLDGFALAHGLARVAPGVDLLTGPAGIASPFLAPFEIVDVLPADLKRLRRLVAERGLGTLEIKTKDVGIRPEILRAQLRPEGPNRATLFILGGGGGGTRAILANRLVPAAQKDVANPGE